VQFVNNSVQFLDRAFADIDRLQRSYAELRDAAAAGHLTPELMDRVADAEDVADVEYLRERVPQAIERSFHGLERVAKIVGAMRSFAHPPTTDREPVDLCDVVKKSLVVSANEYKYVADLNVELDELPLVQANTGDLNQIVLNLIVNASHAIADAVGESGGRGAITIRTRVHDGQAEIQIADTGGGIPPDIAERVFDPFFTTKEIGRGTGQGLTISRTLVERHHGQIYFESRPGEGTTFTVALPIATSDEQTRGLAA
jgi:signal transduction histidine kinase